MAKTKQITPQDVISAIEIFTTQEQLQIRNSITKLLEEKAAKADAELKLLKGGQ